MWARARVLVVATTLEECMGAGYKSSSEGLQIRKGRMILYSQRIYGLRTYLGV